MLCVGMSLSMKRNLCKYLNIYSQLSITRGGQEDYNPHGRQEDRPNKIENCLRYESSSYRIGVSIGIALKER